MGRLRDLALALVLAVAGVGGAWAQEPGDLPDLDVDISIDVVTDFDQLEHGADLTVEGHDDDGDIHVMTPGDRDHGDHDEGEVGDHDDGEMGGHDEVEMEDHGAEVDDDLGGLDEGTDGIDDEHDDAAGD